MSKSLTQREALGRLFLSVWEGLPARWRPSVQQQGTPGPLSGKETLGHWELSPSKLQLLRPEGFSETPSSCPTFVPCRRVGLASTKQILTPPRKQQQPTHWGSFPPRPLKILKNFPLCHPKLAPRDAELATCSCPCLTPSHEFWLHHIMEPLPKCTFP